VRGYLIHFGLDSLVMVGSYTIERYDATSQLFTHQRVSHSCAFLSHLGKDNQRQIICLDSLEDFPLASAPNQVQDLARAPYSQIRPLIF
jgi:hypothetical protein